MISRLLHPISKWLIITAGIAALTLVSCGPPEELEVSDLLQLDGAAWIRSVREGSKSRVGHLAVHEGSVYVSVLPPRWSEEGLVVKYDDQGSVVWTRTLGPRGRIHNLVPISDAIYVVGSRAGFPDLGRYIARYSSDMNQELWRSELTGMFDIIEILPDRSENLYVVGHTRGEFSGQTPIGPQDIFVQKYGPTGHLLWTRIVGTQDFDLPVDAALDVSGYLYVAGTTSTSPPSGLAPHRRSFLSSLSPEGEVMWTHYLDSLDQVRVRAIAAGGNVGDRIYIAGDILNSERLVSGLFVRVYDGDGNELDRQQFATISGVTRHRSVNIDIQDNLEIYVIGAYQIAGCSQKESCVIGEYTADGNLSWTGNLWMDLSAKHRISSAYVDEVALVPDEYGTLYARIDVGAIPKRNIPLGDVAADHYGILVKTELSP